MLLLGVLGPVAHSQDHGLDPVGVEDRGIGPPGDHFCLGSEPGRGDRLLRQLDRGGILRDLRRLVIGRGPSRPSCLSATAA